METVNLDPATLRAIIELQLEDIDSTTNETHENGEVNNFELAFKAQRSELESCLRFEDDRRFCNDIARGNMTRDSDTIPAQDSTEPRDRSGGSDPADEIARPGQSGSGSMDDYQRGVQCRLSNKSSSERVSSDQSKELTTRILTSSHRAQWL